MFLQIEQLSVRYPHATACAVQSVSLGLDAGQIGVLTGPSGSGKTTLLRAIAGLEQPHAGHILLDREVLDDRDVRIAAEQRRIGMVFQDFALFPHLSIAANVGFGLRDGHKQEHRRRVQDMLELVGLVGEQDKFPHQLSGGQQQRVALARALAPQPRLLLLDEPFSSLDVDLRQRLAEEVRHILRQAGMTALMVTHDQQEAFAIADVVGVMQHSRLEQWDSPYALYHRPATRFVADFIGQGVLVPGELVGAPGNMAMQTPLGRLTDITPVVTALHTQAVSGRQFDVLLRSDDIVHDELSPLKARIVRKSFRGADFLYTLRLGDGIELLSSVRSYHDHAIGESIGIRLDVRQIVAFPRFDAD